MNERVLRRYLVRQHVHSLCASDSFRYRHASLRDLTSSVIEELATEFIITGSSKIALLQIGAKIKKLIDLFRKAPQLWTKIKDTLGIQGITDIPSKLRDWAKQGRDYIKKLAKGIASTFPLSLYTIPKGKMPSLTDLLERIMKNSPFLQKALSKINTHVVQPLDRWIEKYIPRVGKPIKAAIFIYVWLNVAEISWDMKGLLAGFTGNISIGELFSSLPESGIGLLLALGGVGYHLLPITILARLIWLVGAHYLQWEAGKGFKVNWAKITGDRSARPELVKV